MAHYRPRNYASNAAGVTRTELLVLVVVALALAIVLLGPVRGYFEFRSVGRAVESAKTLNTLLAQYATDNNGVYPVGEGTRAEGKSEGIALDLLLNNYTPNADIFAVGSTSRYSGATKDYADLAPENISWDFTAGATTTTGITSTVPDYLPIVFTTGETIDYKKAESQGLMPEPSGNGPFGRQGFVVAYKGGNVLFISTKTDAKDIPHVSMISNFIDTGTYTEIRP